MNSRAALILALGIAAAAACVAGGIAVRPVVEEGVRRGATATLELDLLRGELEETRAALARCEEAAAATGAGDER